MQLTGRQRLAGVVRMIRDGLGNVFARPPRSCSFSAAGRRVPAWLYCARSVAPGVLILHTAWGLGAHERAFARKLAEIGFASMVVSYSSLTTGTALLADDSRRQSVEEIATAALAHLRAQPEVDAARVAVVGFSLGGHLAVQLAVGRSPPNAVVVYYGMVPQAAAIMPSLSVPMLLLQGGRDDPEFVHAAESAASVARERGRDCELVVYPDAIHQFDLFQPASGPAVDAWSRSCAFLSRHLGRHADPGSANA